MEVDEHKHRGASYKCDEKRMYDITAKLGQPCVFNRYNPDSKDSDQNKLLKMIKSYLNFQDIFSEMFDEADSDNIQEEICGMLNIGVTGFKKEYLFY